MRLSSQANRLPSLDIEISPLASSRKLSILNQNGIKNKFLTPQHFTVAFQIKDRIAIYVGGTEMVGILQVVTLTYTGLGGAGQTKSS